MKIKIIAKILNKEEEVLTLSQTATKLKISRQAALKLINEGKVRAIRTKEFNENIYLIPLNDLKNFRKEAKSGK